MRISLTEFCDRLISLDKDSPLSRSENNLGEEDWDAGIISGAEGGTLETGIPTTISDSNLAT